MLYLFSVIRDNAYLVKWIILLMGPLSSYIIIPTNTNGVCIISVLAGTFILSTIW